DPRAFDPSRVLAPGNRRFRIGDAAFTEIRHILRERLARALADGERGVGEALRRAGVGAPPAPADPPQAWDRVIFAGPVREHLFHDLDGTVARLQRSRALRREVAGGISWSELLGEFAEVTRCLRRAEAVHLLRSALEFASRGLDHQETRERYLEGRLCRFGFAEPVQSGVRTSTILFADLRGFTRASEGAVSEGELARELYEIFDPAALIVKRFGGTIDKYLGDGFMATFTGGTRPGEEVLAAVRSAVVLQQVLGRLRRLGRTAFRMGISLHIGRVAVARFLIDDQQAATTVIGRQVNVAGRLSASEGDPAAARQAPGARSVGEVTIDGAGRLINHGIAVSGPLLDVLRRQVACEPFSESGIDGVRWFDRDLSLWLHFGHVGEARFRGLEAAIPVYSLGYAMPQPAEGS
ncbi:MAG TPA: adenylate/guanylate cyclase domain-containing protein, partial [Vicinamibacteria bacterium]